MTQTTPPNDSLRWLANMQNENAIEAARTFARLCAAFYAELINAGIDREVAVALTTALITRLHSSHGDATNTATGE